MIIILHIIFIPIFFIKQLKDILNKLKDIIYSIKNIKVMKEDKKINKGNFNKETKNKINKKNKDKIINNQNKKIPKKSKKGKKSKTINKKTHFINIDNNKKEIIFNNINNSNLINSNNILNKNNNRDKFQKKKNKIKKIKNTMKLKDDEINVLTYDLAIHQDKRSYCEYYVSLLRTKHILIFSFCGVDDYNSKIIKMDLFFVGFTIYYTINALFYTDDIMHKIYEDKGSFDFIYQLPKNIYSSLISMVLNIILKNLALSNNAILTFKREKERKDIDKKGNNLEKILRLKFILYFIISFLFLLLFWYYISMFGAIYKNTQLHLLKDTLMSFGLSLFYPFIIYLLPGLLRIPALSDIKKNRKCLYKFSKILQIF